MNTKGFWGTAELRETAREGVESCVLKERRISDPPTERCLALHSYPRATVPPSSRNHEWTPAVAEPSAYAKASSRRDGAAGK